MVLCKSLVEGSDCKHQNGKSKKCGGQERNRERRKEGRKGGRERRRDRGRDRSEREIM